MGRFISRSRLLGRFGRPAPPCDGAAGGRGRPGGEIELPVARRFRRAGVCAERSGGPPPRRPRRRTAHVEPLRLDPRHPLSGGRGQDRRALRLLAAVLARLAPVVARAERGRQPHRLLQRRPERLDRHEALARIERERLLEHPVDLGGHVGAVAARRGAALLVEAGAAHRPRLAVERRRPAERLDHAQGEPPHVRPRPRLAPRLGRPLLRRAVRRRERRHLVLRDRVPRDAADRLRRRALRLRDAEVEDLHGLGAVEAGEEEVLRLQIAVDDRDRPLRPREVVRLRQRGRDGPHHLHDLVQPERRLPLLAPPRDDAVERLPVQPLQREEGHEAPVAQVQHVDVERPADLGDRRREPEHQLRLLAELLQERVALLHAHLLRDLQALDRHRRAEPPCSARYTTAKPPSATTFCTWKLPAWVVPTMPKTSSAAMVAASTHIPSRGTCGGRPRTPARARTPRSSPPSSRPPPLRAAPTAPKLAGAS